MTLIKLCGEKLLETLGEDRGNIIVIGVNKPLSDKTKQQK